MLRMRYLYNLQYFLLTFISKSKQEWMKAVCIGESLGLIGQMCINRTFKQLKSLLQYKCQKYNTWNWTISINFVMVQRFTSTWIAPDKRNMATSIYKQIWKSKEKSRATKEFLANRIIIDSELCCTIVMIILNYWDTKMKDLLIL